MAVVAIAIMLEHSMIRNAEVIAESPPKDGEKEFCLLSLSFAYAI